MTLNEALDSEKVKEFVKDDKNAKDFYAAFCNRDWFPLSAEIKKEDIGNGDGFTWRAAGGLVASLREKGETVLLPSIYNNVMRQRIRNFFLFGLITAEQEQDLYQNLKK